MAQPPLIPRDVLFGNPEKASPSLSPDGKCLAYLAPDEKDVLQVWLRTLGQADDRKLTDDPKRGIRSYFWTYDGEQLIYMQDTDGDENFHLLAVNVVTGAVRDLTPFPGVRAALVAWDHKFPDEVLVQMNRRDAKVFDVHRVDLRSGKVELEAENPGNIVSWVADGALKVRAAAAATPDGGTDLLVRADAESEFPLHRHWSPDENGGPTMFSQDGKTLYIEGNHDANAIRLLAVDVETGRETVVAEDARYDVSGLCVHPTARTIQAVAFYKDTLQWTVLDDAIAGDFEALGKVRTGELRIVSRDLADATWIVAYTTDDGPIYYYTYHRASKTAALLFSNQSKLEDQPLAPMEPVSYPARDGLEIHGYLTMPPGLAPKDLPAVLVVHGGPWGRDTWGYNAIAQWLANRGYVVLQINYRGSAGYGKDFLNAGNREWGGKMHDDLIDGVEWLRGRDLVDPDRIAIFGGSYGGYATLVGMAFTPEVFACGVDIVGPSSIATLMRSIPPYWAPMMAMFKHRVGDLETEEEFLDSCSPLFKADQIRRPLLIGQGANDPRVKQAESDQIVEAMRKNDLQVEYVVYTDEGHGFARPENRMHFNARAEQFLAKHLGGRCEPMSDIEGHSGVEK